MLKFDGALGTADALFDDAKRSHESDNFKPLCQFRGVEDVVGTVNGLKAGALNLGVI